MRVAHSVQAFCANGQQEELKGAVHALACMVSVAMAAYNIAAWNYRRQPHLKMNAIVYSLAVAWEVKQTLRHLQKCTCEPVPEKVAA